MKKQLTDQQHYDICVKLYEKKGASAVYKYADKNGIDDWSYCDGCETNTPTVSGDCCLVCGSTKTPTDNWTVEKKDKIESMLINFLTELGFDIPFKYEEIVQFCYEDICEYADERNWNKLDVEKSFINWIEFKRGEIIR